MASYKLVIHIDPKILQMGASDNLCIARQVNGKFSVVFQGASVNPVGRHTRLFATNTFAWEDKYRVFASVIYKTGMQISAATEPVEIKFGEQATFENSVITPPVPADPSMFKKGSPDDSFILANIPNDLAAAVECKTGDTWTPIYVDQGPGAGFRELQPVNKYALFWSNEIVNESIIEFSRTQQPWEFSFSHGEHELSVRFGYKTPNTPKDPTEQPRWIME